MITYVFFCFFFVVVVVVVFCFTCKAECDQSRTDLKRHLYFDKSLSRESGNFYSSRGFLKLFTSHFQSLHDRVVLTYLYNFDP